jgi:tetratricopeptide (TPR) repeat protein
MGSEANGSRELRQRWLVLALAATVPALFAWYAEQAGDSAGIPKTAAISASPAAPPLSDSEVGTVGSASSTPVATPTFLEELADGKPSDARGDETLPAPRDEFAGVVARVAETGLREIDLQFLEANEMLADAGPAVTGSPTGQVVCRKAEDKIRRASELSQRGALFASRNELLSVLEMIAEAKDEKHGAPRRAVALAAGLRALEEAGDFANRSASSPPSEGMEVILASHRTPVAKSPQAASLTPGQLADLYFRYAQVQLGAAVANEPAGSMALHALGKLYSQFAAIEPGTFPQADRRAFALQQAALLARPDNYLAEHELGVLLAESGHWDEAERTLVRVAQRRNNPVVLRNLARVQRQSGRIAYAEANERQATALAANSPALMQGPVAWMTPQQFVQAGQSANFASGPAAVAAAPNPSGPTVQSAARSAPAVRR